MITFGATMLRALLLCLLCLVLTLPARAEPPGPPVEVGGDYKIGAGDTVSVQVYGEPSLSGQFPVDACGGLDFPLLGRVLVGGLAPPEVMIMLRTQLMAGYLVNPSVTVSVSGFRSQPVQVLGAVAKPGLYYLHGPTTVMAILSEAGGVAQSGVNEVRITHQGEEQAPVVLPYNELLSRSADELSVRGGDIVFVPQSLVTVIGSVAKPGEVAYRNGLTVTQCIANTGGALATAALGQVYVLRGDKRIRVNLRRVFSGQAADVLLEAGDKLYVPESAI